MFLFIFKFLEMSLPTSYKVSSLSSKWIILPVPGVSSLLEKLPHLQTLKQCSVGNAPIQNNAFMRNLISLNMVSHMSVTSCFNVLHVIAVN